MARGMGGSSPANVSHHLKGTEFPARKEALIEQAKHNHAGNDILDTIRKMPDREFKNMADVMKGYGETK